MGVSAGPARIEAELDGRGRTVLPVLAGAGPVALRQWRRPPPGEPAEVAMVGSMAGPLGGDRYGVRVTVGPGARLRVTSVAATVSLPGDGPAHCTLELSVAPGGLLDWRPEPVVAAAGSHLLLETRVELAAGAALLLREEQVLGRRHDWTSGAGPGRLTATLTVRQDGVEILAQQTDLGPGAPGWDGPAVLGPHRALGQLLAVHRPLHPPEEEAAPDGGAVLLTLPGSGARLLTALAPDALLLRRLLTGREGPAHREADGTGATQRQAQPACAGRLPRLSSEAR
ncbi:urease accessory protein [Streptomyces tateyamensis]|uniref:Urease accessory protein UreD n=1 Tax=Streptomyces tateyamensis TaxID=565073 RepID=A0A2V4NEX6_9ACTN|nr:urease accessory protein UreD [Streptomyces tateyamensis]PYC78860.1 urease accessory protein [Streptomyces tateyamensis]